MKHIFFLIIAVSLSLVTVQQAYATHYSSIGLDDIFEWREHDNNADADVESHCWFEGQNELPDDQTGISWWCHSHTGSDPHQSQMYIMKVFPFDLLHNGTTSTITWDLNYQFDNAGTEYGWTLGIMDGAYDYKATTNKLGFPDDVHWGADGGACNGGYSNPAWANATGWALCMDNDNTSNEDDYITGTGSVDSTVTGFFTEAPKSSKGEVSASMTITNTEWLTVQEPYVTIFLVFLNQYSASEYAFDSYIQPDFLKITNTDYGTLQWDFPQSLAEVTTWETYGGAGMYELNGTSNDYGWVRSFTESVPDPPTNLIAVIDSADIDLDWDAPVFNGYSPITGYKIERESPIGGGFSVLVANTGTTVTAYEDTTIVVGQEYNYRVRALNVHGESLPSNESKDGNPGTSTDDPNPEVTCPESLTQFLLEASAVGTDRATLCWNGQNLPQTNLLGYQGNSTTPWGNPLTIITGFNNTGTPNATTKLITGLSPNTQYSMRVLAWQNGSMNNVTNIVNITTLPSTFDIDDLNFDGAVNPFQLEWFFKRVDLGNNMSSILVDWPNTYDPTCVFDFKFANTNQTFTSISTITHPDYSDRNMANFTLEDPDNELITIICTADETETEGRYIVTQSNYPLLQQIAGFRAGDYGTEGNFGIFDFITMVVVIFSMIGFNRVNSAVGSVFSIIVIGVASYFGFIQWYSAALMGAVIAVTGLAIFMHHRDDVAN